jgi:hypothetical protein
VPGRRGPGWIVHLLTVLALALILPCAAQASRRPTPRERAAITRAAVATAGSPTQRVRVSDIEVSTAGRWATATVSLYLRSAPEEPEQASEDTFYRARGKWRDTANGNTPDRTPPKAVVEDLDLPTQGEGTSHTLVILIAAAGILLLLGVVGGRGKQPVRQPPGGREPRSSSPTPVQPSTEYRTTCSSCNGEGKRRCDHCGGRGGWDGPHPHSPGNLMWVTCPACGGVQRTCDACNGRGWT